MPLMRINPPAECQQDPGKIFATAFGAREASEMSEQDELPLPEHASAAGWGARARLASLEVGTGIEPVFTDLQSGA